MGASSLSRAAAAPAAGLGHFHSQEPGEHRVALRAGWQQGRVEGAGDRPGHIEGWGLKGLSDGKFQTS